MCHVDPRRLQDYIGFWSSSWAEKKKTTTTTEGFNVPESDIFKQALTHISSIPKGCIKRLLVMLKQVLYVRKAFNLEDLWFLLNDLPKGNRQ